MVTLTLLEKKYNPISEASIVLTLDQHTQNFCPLTVIPLQISINKEKKLTIKKLNQGSQNYEQFPHAHQRGAGYLISPVNAPPFPTQEF